MDSLSISLPYSFSNLNLELILVFVVVVFQEVCSSPRVNVTIVGTTVPPGFKRIEGQRENIAKGTYSVVNNVDFFTVADLCPDTHPWSYNLGLDCCKFWHRNGDIDKFLDWQDASDKCSDRVACPDLKRKCKDNPITKSKMFCYFLKTLSTL